MRITQVVLLAACIFSFACAPKQGAPLSDYHLCRTIVNNTMNEDKRHIRKWRNEKVRNNISHRIASVVTNVCQKYDLDVNVFIYHMKQESRFRYWVTNSLNAHGLMQLLPRFHSAKLYYVDDGELGKYLMEKSRSGEKIDHRRYLLRIQYNAEVAAMLYRTWLDKYGTYEIMLAAYICGPNHYLTKQLVKNPELLKEKDYRLYKDIRKILGI